MILTGSAEGTHRIDSINKRMIKGILSNMIPVYLQKITIAVDDFAILDMYKFRTSNRDSKSVKQ